MLYSPDNKLTVNAPGTGMRNSRQAWRSGVSPCSGKAFQAVTVAAPDQTEYESVWKMLDNSPIERLFKSLKAEWGL